MNKETLKKVILPLIVLVIIIQVWSVVASMISGFPTPSDTYVYAFGGTTSDGEILKGVLSDPFYVENQDVKGLFWQVLESLKRVFGGFALAVLVGVPVGLMVGMSKNIQYALDPFIQIFKPVSPLAWLPLLLFAFKDIDNTAMSTIFITSIWPIIINTSLGVKSVSEDYYSTDKLN